MTLQNVLLLAGGLGLFLYGMKIMGDGLELAAGSRLRGLLEMLTNNRFLGAFVGFLITAVIQSSSATTVMVVGFVNAGLMNLAQAAGVIMGANVGTTVTGLIIALKLTDIAPIAIFLGVVMLMFSKKKMVQHIGMIIAGFGILFFGMSTMSGAMEPLQHDAGFLKIFEYTRNPLIGILAGMIITATIQSSSASIGILLAMTAAGVVTDLNQAVFILYGQNIGTCITAVLAAAGANKTAKRAAAIHLLFNILGTVMFTVITLLPLPFGFVDLVRSLTGDITKQVAYTHIIFNIVTTIVLLPCANYMVKLACLVVRGEDRQSAEMRLMYLDSRFLSTPPIAAAQAHKEVERMVDLALHNYRLSIDVFLNRNPQFTEEALDNEKIINYLNHQITKYLVKINALDLEYWDNKMLGSLYHVVTDAERIGDHAENIVEFSQGFIEDKNLLSADAVAELRTMAGQVDELVSMALHVFRRQVYDQEEMSQIKAKEDVIDAEMEEFKEHHIKRLNEQVCTPASGMLFINMLTDLERVADHATNIAYSLRYKK